MGNILSQQADPAPMQAAMKNPVIRGIVRGIYCTHYQSTWEATRRSGVWEVMRGLWESKAITFEEFKRVESLQIIVDRKTREAKHGCIALPDGPGWDEILIEAEEAYQQGEKFEEIRKLRGLQAAFDKTRRAA